jgi:hypothetical protein
MSIAVWVGMIALAGLAAETGVVMIVYLDEAFHRHQRRTALVVGHYHHAAAFYDAYDVFDGREQFFGHKKTPESSPALSSD